MVQRLVVNERTIWLKQYKTGSRRMRLGMLDRVAKALEIPALRPPPYFTGEQRKQVELRRLCELQDSQVVVPEVVGEGHAMLLLDDIGVSLSSRLRQLKGDDGARNRLVARVIEAISEVHAKGQYLGQPTPRNIVTGNNGIGFIDFEEDPSQVMSLEDAQTRDWILFVHGAASHYRANSEVLGELLSSGISNASPKVAQSVIAATAQLVKIQPFLIPFGGKSGKLVSAISALGFIRIGLLAGATLLLDYLPDHDIDFVAWNIIGLFA